MSKLPSKSSCRQGLPTSRTHGCVCKHCHPWHLDSGNPCRNDVAILKLARMGNIPRPALEKRGITLSSALHLAKFFGVSADFWLNLQIRWDLFNAQAADKNELDLIQDFHHIKKLPDYALKPGWKKRRGLIHTLATENNSDQ